MEPESGRAVTEAAQAEEELGVSPVQTRAVSGRSEGREEEAWEARSRVLAAWAMELELQRALGTRRELSKALAASWLLRFFAAIDTPCLYRIS